MYKCILFWILSCLNAAVYNNVFSHLECSKNSICITINHLQVQEFTDDFSSLSFNNCSIQNLNRKLSNRTHTIICLDLFGDECAARMKSSDSSSEFENQAEDVQKYLIFSVEATLLMTKKWLSEPVQTHLTNRDPRIFQNFECHFRSKGFITAGSSWFFEDRKTESATPKSGSGNFEVGVLVSGDRTCGSALSSKNLPETIFVCITVFNITDPTVVITIDGIWGTKTSNENGIPYIEYLENGCSFRDDHEIQHLNKKDLRAIVPISPQLLKGASTMHYHVNVSLCMTASCLRENCDFPKNLRGRVHGLPIQLGRSSSGELILPPPKTNSLEQLAILKSYDLPLSVDIIHFYNWMDAEIEKKRIEAQKFGILRIETIDKQAYANRYKSMYFEKRAKRSTYGDAVLPKIVVYTSSDEILTSDHKIISSQPIFIEQKLNYSTEFIFITSAGLFVMVLIILLSWYVYFKILK